MSADILQDLARAKAVFQLRAIETIIRGPSPCHPGAITMTNTPSPPSRLERCIAYRRTSKENPA